MPIQPKDVFDRLSTEIQVQITDELSEILKEVIDAQLCVDNPTHMQNQMHQPPVLQKRGHLPSSTAYPMGPTPTNNSFPLDSPFSTEK